MRAFALGLAHLQDGRRMPVPVKRGEEVTDHDALEIDLEVSRVQDAHAVRSRVAFTADVFEGAAHVAIGKWAGRVHGSVGRGLAFTYGDLGGGC